MNNAMECESPLKVGTLNVRGFLNNKKRKVVLNNFKREKLDVVGIQEAHISTVDEIRVLERQWKGPVHVCPCGINRSKGVATLFRCGTPREDVKMLFASVKGTIMVSSLKLQSETVYIINAYSPCDEHEKIIV